MATPQTTKARELDTARLLMVTATLLHACEQFVQDHEASGHYCAGLNAAYWQAQRAIRLEKGAH